MVKNKANARLCCTLWSGVFLSLLFSFSLSLSIADAIHPEGSPGSCWGWTPA